MGKIRLGWVAGLLVCIFSISVFAQTPGASTGALPAPPSVSPEQKISEPKTDVLFIIDSSGSMASILEGQRMIDWAKKAVKGAAGQLPAEASAGLRVYSHRIDKSNKEASCKDTELVVPISQGTGALIAASADKLEPRGWTPIAYSLEQAEGDFNNNLERLHTIILVSDGEETCGGDPSAIMRALAAKGYKFKLCTVGFNVEEVAKKQLMALANEFGCTYTDARSGLSLEQELSKLTQQSFLIDKKEIDNRVRGGDNFTSAVHLEAGKRYRLDHHQRKGQFDYFLFDLKAGESVSVHAYPVEKCVQIAGDQSKESNGKSYCDPEAFHFVLLDKDQKQVAEVAAHSTAAIKSRLVELGSGGPYYLIVGSATSDMHRDNEFMVEVTEFGDANTNQDAGDIFSTAIPILPGIYDTNRISGIDVTDIFKISLNGPSLVKAVVTHVKKTNFGDIHAEILDELGGVLDGKTIYVNESATFEPKAAVSGTVYLRIKTASNQFKDDQIFYSLGVSVTPAPAVAAPQTGATIDSPASPPPPPPPPPGPPPSEKPQASSTVPTTVSLVASQASSGHSPLWIAFVGLGFFLFAIGIVLFCLKKPITQPNTLGKILGWYGVVASVIGAEAGLWQVASMLTFFNQVAFTIFVVLVNALGILGAACLLSGRNERLSFWWSYFQVPWIALNLHWVGFAYFCSWFLGLPAFFTLATNAPHVGGYFNAHFGAAFSILFSASLEEGFGIGLGVNLIALAYLILLFVHRRKKKQSLPATTATV